MAGTIVKFPSRDERNDRIDQEILDMERAARIDEIADRVLRELDVLRQISGDVAATWPIED